MRCHGSTKDQWRSMSLFWSTWKVSTDAVSAVFEECGWLHTDIEHPASSARSQGS